jgi:hypothetical protein
VRIPDAGEFGRRNRFAGHPVIPKSGLMPPARIAYQSSVLIRFQPYASGPIGAQVIAIHAGNYFQLDAFGADGLTFAYVGAASENLAVGLRHHSGDALLALGLALRQQAQVGDFSRYE